jgi:ABC-type lipoprotein release transport system permease subunit
MAHVGGKYKCQVALLSYALKNAGQTVNTIRPDWYLFFDFLKNPVFSSVMAITTSFYAAFYASRRAAKGALIRASTNLYKDKPC